MPRHSQKLVTTGLDPVVHAELRRANAGGSIRKRRFRIDDERKERKKISEAKRRQTQ
jgi:hypothetical protein